MRERPLLLPLVALMAGISATAFTGVQFPEWYFIPAVFSLLCGLIYKRHILSSAGVVSISFLWGSLAAASFAIPSFPADHSFNKKSDPPVSVAGVIYQRSQKNRNSTSVFLQVESIDGLTATGRLKVNVKSGTVAVKTGDRVRVKTRLTSPRNLGIPGEYDYQRSLAIRGIFVTGYLAHAAEIELIKEAVSFRFKRKLDETALRLCRFIDNSISGPEAGVLQALLVGERGAVPPGIEALYARTGVNHILSISGFHVGILAVVIYQLLAFAARLSGFLLLYNIRWKLMLATLPMLLFYLLVSGAAPATVRSVLMISACFVALFLEMETDSVNILSIAAFAILAAAPGALFDISFQLSFIALWGILVLTPLMLQPYRGERKGALFKSLQFVAVSAAAILATLLPVAYTFHRVSIAGLLSNFIVVPLLGYGAVVLGFSALALSFIFPSAASILIKTAAMLVTWSNGAMNMIDSLPQPSPFSQSLLHVALSLAMLSVLTLFRRNRQRLIASIAVLILGCFAGYAQKDQKSALKVIFFSLGQGESSLLRFPDGTTMLVDGGGALHENGFDVGERLLAPALLTLGVNRIDRMVLSHPHPDHLKGLEYVARNFQVGEFWESGYYYHSPDYRRLKEVLASKMVPVRIVNAGVPGFKTGSALIEPLAPPAPHSERFESLVISDANDESMVFRLSQGRFSILFTGDSGFESEAGLLERGVKINSSVLKVAHHGSLNSSSIPFLRAVSPKLSLISAGYKNSFGLPAPRTVRDIENTGSAIHRTDIDGTVELSVTPDDGSFTLKKYPPAQIDTHSN